MLSTARSAAKIAYLTSLRAFHPDHQPLTTPSEEELSSFLPPSPPSPKGDEELWNPRDNKWYTFEIDNLDHTSLCPFWTGSEVQKQFWTGIGFFLASVDRLSGYPVEMRLDEPATGM
uniref:Uncharacterized protein n=2 Tax=Kalmanozyma brasiliensis (strain GHG001) TaxID=1365824 RepID=V5GL51_KALBG